MKFRFITDKLLMLGILLLLCLIILIIANYGAQTRQLNNELKESSKNVSRSMDVLIHSEKILSILKDNETGLREFIQTGQRKYIAPLENSKKEISHHLGQLKQLSLQNAFLLSMVDSLNFHINKRNDFFARIIGIYDLNGAQAANEVLNGAKGTYETETISREFDKIKITEYMLLKPGEQTGKKYFLTANKVFTLALAGMLILLVVFIQKARTEIIAKRKNAALLQKMNAQLEEKDLKRTDELEKSKHLLSETFDRITDAFVGLDENWCYTYMNKKAGEVFNRNPGQMIGKHIWTEFPEGVNQPFYNAYYKAMETQQYIYLEEYYPPYENWFENHIYPSPHGLSIFFKNITEKKKTELALKESEEKYRTLIEQAADGIFITDQHGSFLDINESICQLSGYTKKEISHLFIKDLLAKEENYIPLPVDELKAGKPVTQQRKIKRKDGSVVAIEITGRQLPDGKIFGMVRDLTERLRAEQELQKEKELSDKIINSLPGLFYLADPTPKMLRWNNAFEKISGYTGEELKNIVPITLFNAEDHIAIMQSLEKTYREGLSDVEARLHTKNGENIPFYFTGVGLTYNGKPAMLGTGIDITERKITEEKINKEKLLSDTIINNLPGIFYLYDEQGRFLKWNKNFENVSGFSTQEISTMHPLDFYDETDKEKIKKRIQSVFEKNTPGIELELQTRQKEKIPFYINSVTIEYEGKKCLLGIGINLTERNKAEEEKRMVTEGLKISEIKYHTLIERVSDGFVSLDNNWCFTYMNKRAGEITRKDPGLMIGKNIWAEFPDLVDTPFYKAYHKAKTTQQYIYLEEHYTGFNLWLENHLYPSPEGLSIFFKDITAQKRADREKEKLLKENEALINSTTDLLWSVSNDYTLIAANSSFINGLKENGGYLIKPGDNILPPEYFKEDYLQYWKSIYSKGLTGEKVITEIYTPQANSADFHWFEIKIDPILVGKKISGIACSMRNITERKKIANDIIQSNERYELIGKATNDGLWDWNLETNQVWGNEMHQQIYGLKKTDPVPEFEEWRRRIHPEDRERVVQALQKANSLNLTSYIEEYRFNSENKGWIYVYGRTLIERNDAGKAVRLIGSMMDVTESKNAEKGLIESEEKFRTLVQQAAEGIFIVDQQGNYLEANESAAILTGYSITELKKMNAIDIIDAEDLKSNPLKLEEIKRGDPVYAERLIRKKDGSTINVEISAKLMNTGKVITVFRDITRRKLAEQQLKDSEERLRLSLKAASQGLFDVNVQTGEAIVNDEYALMLGYDPATFIESNALWLARVHPDDQPSTSKAYQDYVLGKTADYKIEFRQKTKDNNWKWILSMGKIVSYDPHGNPLRILGTHTDINERKKAEEALLNAEQRLQFLLSSTPAVIYSAQAVFPFATTYISDNITEQTGYLPEEFIGIPNFWSDNIHPDDKEKTINDLAHLYEKKYHIHEYRFLLKDGSYLWMHDEVKLIVDAAGNPLEMVGYWINIDKRKKAEQAITESEEKYRTLVEQASDAIFIADANGKFVTVNTSACKLSGFTEKELLQKTIFDFAIIEDLEKNPFHFNELKQGKTVFVDRLMKVKGDQVMNIEVNAKLLSDGRLLTFVRDITERKKNEQALAQSENRLRTIYNTEPECIKIIGAHGELKEMNPAGLAMIEADSLEQVKEKSVLGIINEPYRKAFQELTKKVFKGKTGALEFEITGLKGTRRWLETHAVPMKDTDGKITSLLGVTRDITDRKKAEVEIKKTTKQLRQLTAHLQNIREEERKRIGREIHDELGQQLTAIKMDVVWIDKKTPKATESIKNKLKNIIGLLDGSNLSVRRILSELRPDILNDYGLLEALEWQGRQFTASSSIPIEFTSNVSENKFNENFTTCIFRVYQEALTNIMRYAAAKNVISSLSSFDDQIIFTIEDDGKGFDTNAVNNKKSFGILGMKERVLSLNGIFNLISSPGNGTKITLSLPCSNI